VKKYRLHVGYGAHPVNVTHSIKGKLMKYCCICEEIVGDGDTCEDCGGTTENVTKVYEIKVENLCPHCHTKVIRIVTTTDPNYANHSPKWCSVCKTDILTTNTVLHVVEICDGSRNIQELFRKEIQQGEH